MKKIFILILCSLLVLTSGCVALKNKDNDKVGYAITDELGNTAIINKDSRVVSCVASFTQCWLLSGGNVVGITNDCITERGMDFDSNVTIIGSTKTIDLEKIVELNPDYVILSYDVAAQRQMEDTLKQMGIAYGYFRVDMFEDYALLMDKFCKANEREDLYEVNVTSVKEKIDEIKSNIPKDTDKTALLLRAYSTGMKAKRDDNIAGVILKEFGITNIADLCPSILEDMSMEYIIQNDPDYIFVTTMGDEEAAIEYLTNNAVNDPAWKGLCAVKNGNFVILPQELFHYKPNEKWNDSYEHLAKILYPEIFGK